MLRDIALLAVDKAAYNEALNGFQWSVSLVGVAVLILGISMLFSKHKVVGLIFCMVGSGIAIYPWMAFAPIK
jgi:hypothetical protein